MYLSSREATIFLVASYVACRVRSSPSGASCTALLFSQVSCGDRSPGHTPCGCMFYALQ